MMTEFIIDSINRHQEELTALSRKIWEHPEIGWKETQAVLWTAELLEKNGFTVEIPADPGHGDLATNFAMVNAKALHMSPRAIASAVAEKHGGKITAAMEGNWLVFTCHLQKETKK